MGLRDGQPLGAWIDRFGGGKATHHQTRSHNSRLVLRTIYGEGPMSRADVARATTLTRPTVSELVQEWLEESLIEQIGLSGSGAGKPPTFLRFVDDAKLIVSVDVAEAELRGALVDLRGQVRRQMVRSTSGLDSKRILVELDTLLNDLTSAADRRLLGIGIAVPGLVDPREGTVQRAVHLDWRDFPLGQRIEEQHRLPTRIVNDSQASALAVHMFGPGPSEENLLVVNAGRGLGAGLIVGGWLYSGDAGGAGEIGHTIVDGPMEQLSCVCGRVGCLETVASSDGLLRRVRTDARAKLTPGLAEYAAAPEALRLHTLKRLMERGDDVVTAHVTASGEALGSALATLIGALDVAHIIMVGSMTELGEYWMEPLRDVALRKATPTIAAQCHIEAAEPDPDLALRGSAAYLLRHELGLLPILTAASVATPSVSPGSTELAVRSHVSGTSRKRMQRRR